MSEIIVAHNEDYIEIIRVGHHYYLNERRGGFIIHMNHKVHRDDAIEKVMKENGVIPNECNFDLCHPRKWTWRLDRKPAVAEYITGTVSVKKLLIDAVPMFGVFYENQMVVLRQCGDGAFCEMEAAVAGD